MTRGQPAWREQDWKAINRATSIISKLLVLIIVLRMGSSDRGPFGLRFP